MASSIFKLSSVATGCCHIPGMDYDDTVVRMTPLRLLLAVALYHKMYAHGMDVKNEFIHGQLERDIYMQQAEGCIDKARQEYACNLNRSVYGRKESPLQLYNTIRPVQELIGVKACPGDIGLFVGRVDNIIILLAKYVNDR